MNLGPNKKKIKWVWVQVDPTHLHPYWRRRANCIRGGSVGSWTRMRELLFPPTFTGV